MAKRKGFSGAFGAAVDLFGLNAAGELTKVHGVALGAAIQLAGSWAIKKWAASYSDHANLISGAVGVGAGLFLARTHEEAGKATAFTAGALGVGRWAYDKWFAGKSLDGVSAEALEPLSEAQFQLAAPSIQDAPMLRGAEQVAASGGPSVNSLGLHYGATLFGGSE